MKKAILGISAVAILFLTANFAAAQKPVRVKFAKGAKQKIITGNLNSYKGVRVYVVKVRAGQTLKIEQIKSDSSDKYVTVAIKSPTGEDVTDSDASCNNRKEVSPTEAGDYVITVSECMKADEWRGSFQLKIRAE